jgi:hypothetical protein
MNAIFIHADCRTQVLSGEMPPDLTTIAVLTQAATVALDEISTRQQGLADGDASAL